MKKFTCLALITIMAMPMAAAANPGKGNNGNNGNSSNSGSNGNGNGNGNGVAIGRDATRLTQTRISNSGGGAGGNPHWGSQPHQSPWSNEAYPGYNTGEAFQRGNTDTYNGVAKRGEQAPWDRDPGRSGKNAKGGNASNVWDGTPGDTPPRNN